MAYDVMPFSTASYLADTQHFSIAQHGAYMLILMTMWRSGGWLDDDDNKLARICKIPVGRWKTLGKDIRALLLSQNGRLSQKRLLREMDLVSKKCSKARENGKRGGEVKALKYNNVALADATFSLQQNASDMDELPLNVTTSQSSIDSQLEKNLTSVSQQVSKEIHSGRRSPRRPMLDSWRPSDHGLLYAKQYHFDDQKIEEMVRACRNYHIKHGTMIAGLRGLDATWRTWIDNEVKFDKRRKEKLIEPKPNWQQARDGAESYLRQNRQRASNGHTHTDRTTVSGFAVPRIGSDVHPRAMATDIDPRSGDVR